MQAFLRRMFTREREEEIKSQEEPKDRRTARKRKRVVRAGRRPESQRRQGRELPRELLAKVLAHSEVLSSGFNDYNSRTGLAVLRLVSKAFQEQVERAHPRELGRFYDAVATRYAVRGAITPIPSERIATMLARIEELEISWDSVERGLVKRLKLPTEKVDKHDMTARTAVGINVLLSTTSSLQNLTLSDSPPFNLIKFDRCPALRSVRSALFELEALCGVDLSGLPALTNVFLDRVVPEYEDVDPKEHGFFVSRTTARFPTSVGSLELRGLRLVGEDVEWLSVPSRPKLEWLDLEGSWIGRYGVRSLQMRTNHSLKKLHLSMCGLDDYAVAELMLALNTTLTDLNLRKNKIAHPSCLKLGHNTGLRCLDLSENPFLSMDFGLDRNTTLRSLDISFGPRAPEAKNLHFLAFQLRENVTLEKLVMRSEAAWRGEFLNDLNIGTFTVAGNTGLRALDIGGHDLSENRIRHLGIQEHPTLKVVTIDRRHRFVSPSPELVAEMQLGGRTVNHRQVEPWDYDPEEDAEKVLAGEMAYVTV